MTQPSEPQDTTPAGDQPTATPQWPSQPAAEPSYASPPAQPAPPGQPAVYGQYPKTSNSAVAALVLSIVAWVVCPIIPAIIALVLANKGEKEIAASNGWVTGDGLITASKIVAWINIGLYAALIALGVLVLVIAAASGALSSW